MQNQLKAIFEPYHVPVNLAINFVDFSRGSILSGAKEDSLAEVHPINGLEHRFDYGMVVILWVGLVVLSLLVLGVILWAIVRYQRLKYQNLNSANGSEAWKNQSASKRKDSVDLEMMIDALKDHIQRDPKPLVSTIQSMLKKQSK